MKKFLILFLVLLTALTLVACGGNDDTTYYKVSFDANGSEPLQSRLVASGTLIAEPKAPTRGGYQFLGWYNGEVLWDFANDKVTSDITLKAEWKRITYIVKFDSNGGSAVEEQVVESGNFATQPKTPNKKDCRFVGWYYGNAEWKFTTDRVLDYITLVAVWENYPTHTVTFDSDGGTAVAPQYIVETNAAQMPTAPTKPGFIFAGWYNGNAAWDFSAPINQSITLKAAWTPAPTFTVTFDSNGADAVESQSVAQGCTATKPQTPNRAQLSRLDGWYNKATGLLWSFETDTVTADVTLVARWINIYKITYNLNGGTAAEGFKTLDYADEGTIIPKQANPTRKDYSFAGWCLSGSETPINQNEYRVGSDIELIAKWEPAVTYTVTFNSDGGSLIPSENLPVGSTVPEPQAKKAGYRIDYWCNAKNNKKWDFNTDTVTENITLKAVWTPTVTITFNTAGGSEIAPITIDKGAVLEKAPKTTMANEKKVVDKWLTPDGTEWVFGTAINENITLTAVWIDAYLVTFNSNGGNAVEPMLVGVGRRIPYMPVPTRSENHILDMWVLDGAGTPWDFENDVVTSDITLVAEWAITTPPHIFGS